MGEEYRVVWQREPDEDTDPDAPWPRPARRPQTRVYQTRKAAHRWWLIVQGRMAEATGRDPDAYACCSGDMCGCGGKTNADLWAETAERIPPLKLARIEVRNVGPWDMLEEGADHAW